MEVLGCDFSVTTTLPLTAYHVGRRVKRPLGLYRVLLMAVPVLRVTKGIHKSSYASKI